MRRPSKNNISASPVHVVVSRRLFLFVSHTPRAAIILIVAAVLFLGCRSRSDTIQSALEGQITVKSSVDPTGDHSGFRVLVANTDGRAIDTLGAASTNEDGQFEMTVTAPDRGIYPLMIWGRQGQKRLASTDYVVAEGDSARLSMTLPLRGRRFHVRSEENAALSAYRNVLAQHRKSLVKRLQTETPDTAAMNRSIRQTSSTLWRLQETFPGTYASQLAATESLSLLSGWNDSLVVARAQTIGPSNPRYVEAAQIARQAAARQDGQDAALQVIDSFAKRAQTREQRAGVQAVRVRAFIDSTQSEAALSAAQRLKNEYSETQWAEWADRAMYEVNNLLPGNPAPNLRMRTVSGDSLTLDSLQGHPIVLEFYRPGAEIFERQLPSRNALYQATRTDSVGFVAISVDPDSVVHQTFTARRFFPGHHVIASEGLDGPLAKAYNVADTPLRVLIDAEGRMVGRYSGSTYLALQEELTQRLQSDI